ncbi:hypothetical protein WAG28_27655 [Bacillus cereus]|uniref:hypothetical protein n=1 Tax=Bacillus cereus TaxID=1396 RepID=UPI003013000D|nr:hypothetical protein [Bacillus sp. Cr_R3]
MPITTLGLLQHELFQSIRQVLFSDSESFLTRHNIEAYIRKFVSVYTFSPCRLTAYNTLSVPFGLLFRMAFGYPVGYFG